MNSNSNTKPNSLIGVGLRHSHYTDALTQTDKHVDFVEVHAENFFAQGGASHSLIREIAQTYPLSIHGTSLGLGSAMPVPKHVLQQFTALVDTTQAFLVSEHLCFNRASLNGEVLHSGDLLPIAYNQASLATIVTHIQQVQESIKRPILIENLSAYISPSQLNAHQSTPLTLKCDDDMTEFEFLIAMCERAGCGLLLDLNNLIINELNQGTEHPLHTIQQRLDTLPADVVGEIHLAGYTPQTDFIIDDHGAPVSEQCWKLYEYALSRFPGTPTLVEWDTQVPQWSVLVNEAAKARRIMNKQGRN